MTKETEIAWCDSTFNPWIGCTKVSPGCTNCYAERLNNRMQWCVWGPTGKRQRTSAANWKQPIAWDRKAAKSIADASERCPMGLGDPTNHIARPRVFCASLADWLDDEVPVEWLADLLDLIRRTPHLDWLLLTKRPQNFFPRIASVTNSAKAYASDLHHFSRTWLNGTPPANAWIGWSVENQQAADERTPHGLKIPARVRFMSCEPLLGPVCVFDGSHVKGRYRGIVPGGRGIDWVICGGESGPHARPMHPDWARSLRDQCAAAGVPFLFKQWGEYVGHSYPAGGVVHVHMDGSIGNYPLHDSWSMRRVGKRAAGRLLDGREHNEFPEVRRD